LQQRLVREMNQVKYSVSLTSWNNWVAAPKTLLVTRLLLPQNLLVERRVADPNDPARCSFEAKFIPKTHQRK